MTAVDYRPLDIFAEHYATLKADYWRQLVIESRPKANARVLALAREHRRGKNWSEQIDHYLEDFRIALAAARNLPMLDARTTAWRVAGPAFVRRMAGAYRLDLPRIYEGDWSSIVWFRLPDEVAADCWLEARQRNSTIASVVAEIVSRHYKV